MGLHVPNCELFGGKFGYKESSLVGLRDYIQIFRLAITFKGSLIFCQVIVSSPSCRGLCRSP